MTDPSVELSVDECWDFLRTRELGRLAFRLGEDLHITPINYAVDLGPQGRRSVLFRTGRSAKLVTAELAGLVALETDEIVGESAVSVVIRGRLRRLLGDEAHRAENLPLRPWVGGDKLDVVEIVPDVVTGRRFGLNRPWLRLRPEPGAGSEPVE